jgi:hypothetical protein
MSFFKRLKELFTKLFQKKEKPVTQLPVSQPPYVPYTPQVDSTPEQLAENAARLTAGLAGNGTVGPRPAPIHTPGSDTPEGRKAWELVQIKMNHALIGNGGPPLTDKEAEKIWQAQKNPKGAPGWVDGTTPMKPKEVAPEVVAPPVTGTGVEGYDVRYQGYDKDHPYITK